jgi:RhoGAP domain
MQCEQYLVLKIVALLNRVADNETENRMTLQNLATVFGPTLFRPPDDEPQAKTLEQMFTRGAHEVVMQTTMILAVIGLKKQGVTFGNSCG